VEKSCDTESAKQFLNEFQSTRESYCDEQLYNCDESALFYTMLPTKYLDLKSAPNKAGLKLRKDRVTLLFCFNKAGTDAEIEAEEEPVQVPTAQEAPNGLDTVIGWLEVQQGVEQVKIMQLVSLKNMILQKKIFSCKKQQKITDFLKK
jgi:hypothetical protein